MESTSPGAVSAGAADVHPGGAASSIYHVERCEQPQAQWKKHHHRQQGIEGFETIVSRKHIVDAEPMRRSTKHLASFQEGGSTSGSDRFSKRARNITKKNQLLTGLQYFKGWKQ